MRKDLKLAQMQRASETLDSVGNLMACGVTSRTETGLYCAGL